jgi:hypothetical protein
VGRRWRWWRRGGRAAWRRAAGAGGRGQRWAAWYGTGSSERQGGRSARGLRLDICRRDRAGLESRSRWHGSLVQEGGSGVLEGCATAKGQFAASQTATSARRKKGPGEGAGMRPRGATLANAPRLLRRQWAASTPCTVIYLGRGACPSLPFSGRACRLPPEGAASRGQHARCEGFGGARAAVVHRGLTRGTTAAAGQQLLFTLHGFAAFHSFRSFTASAKQPPAPGPALSCALG